MATKKLQILGSFPSSTGGFVAQPEPPEDKTLLWVDTSDMVTDHVHTEVIDPAVSVSCTTAGKSQGSHCSTCGEVIIAQQVIPPIGHTPVKDKGYAATCTELGLTEGSHCAVCNMIITHQEVIPALGHNYVNGVCTRCGAKQS